MNNFQGDYNQNQAQGADQYSHMPAGYQPPNMSQAGTNMNPVGLGGDNAAAKREGFLATTTSVFLQAPQAYVEPKTNVVTGDAVLEPIQKPVCTLCNKKIYMPFFNVTSKDVGFRLLHSFMPWKPVFFDMIKDNPDIYGPFWIYTTIIIVLAASGNLYNYSAQPNRAAFSYNFSFLPAAVGVIYLYGFLFPVILWSITKCINLNISFIHILCIHGYSSACLIPVSLLCAIPSEALQWVLLVYALFNSSLILITNFHKQCKELPGNSKHILIGVIAVVQLILFLFYKYYFFGAVYSQVITSTSAPNVVSPSAQKFAQTIPGFSNLAQIPFEIVKPYPDEF